MLTIFKVKIFLKLFLPKHRRKCADVCLYCLVAMRCGAVRQHQIAAEYRLLKQITSVFIHTDCLNTQHLYLFTQIEVKRFRIF